MSDYGESINVLDYKYHKTVYYSNVDNVTKYNLVLKLILTHDNFNFDLATSTGSDFRLLYSLGVLKMWVAQWSTSNQHAVLFFKLPVMPASRTISMYAYWGNPIADPVSDPDAMEFIFYEEFLGDDLSSDKWSGSINSGSGPYGYLLPFAGSFASIIDPLENTHSWVVETSFYTDWDMVGWLSPTPAAGFGLEGTENDFWVYVVHQDRCISNAIVAGGGSSTTRIAEYGGFEQRSYQDVSLSYCEPEDVVKIKLFNRNTYEDIEHSWARKVEGDTRPTNIKIYGNSFYGGYHYGAYPTYISWLAVRNYESEAIGNLDGSNLYIEHEYVEHQVYDVRDYGPDLTSVVYQHETSFGGDPYLLSNNGHDSDDNVWISYIDATLEDYVALTIHTSWSEDITTVSDIHYDSGHEYHYNASKLSDNGDSFMARNFLHLTTTSGWASVKYRPSRTIGAFRMKATSNLDACPRGFVFYGSNFNPGIDLSKAHILTEGIFTQTEEWQSRVITNPSLFRYYILYIHDTYGGNNVEIQEWEMTNFIEERDRRFITQLRLHPATQGDLSYNFPKEVSLLGSSNGVDWDTLLPWTNTYTPFIEHNIAYDKWQRYSFRNTKGYWSFRLICRGNWRAVDSKIVIGEWSLHEFEDESYTYHILDGTTNDIVQVWANSGCDIDANGSIIFVANEYLSKISNNRLVGSHSLPIYYTDFNVIQETE